MGAKPAKQAAHKPSNVQLKIGERQCRNGLTLMAVQNPGVQTFAVGVVFDVDVRDEASGQEGVANLMADCLEEGTKKHNAVQLAEAIEDLGGSLDGSSSGGSMQCPAAVNRKAMGLLVEMLREPAFPVREVKRVQQEVLAEIKADKADPRTVASLRFRKEVYARHPFGRPVRGTSKSIAACTPADLRRFHRQWFVPGNGYVAASGPATVKETLDLLQSNFRGLRGPSVQHQRPTAPNMPKEKRSIHIPMDRAQVHVFLGHPGIRRNHPDFYALSVMDHILGSGSGFTARIPKRLRDAQGLCYSVHASITSSAGEEPGCFSAYIGTSPEHREKAIQGFLEEIQRMRDDLCTAKELQDVQDYLTGSFVFALERNTNLALYVVRAKRFDLGFDYLHKYPDLIRSVTREDLRRVAQTHLHPDKMVVVSAGAG